MTLASPIRGLLALLWLLPGLVAAGLGDDEPLPFEQAFRLEAEVAAPDHVRLHWRIADGYYLYRSRFRFHAETPGLDVGPARFPEGIHKKDPVFGDLQVYKHAVDIDLPLERRTDARALTLSVVAQGCKEGSICYPPHRMRVALRLPPRAPAAPPASPAPVTQDSLAGALGLDQGPGDFLDPDAAFHFEGVEARPDVLVARWTIADGYYLYRDKVHLTLVEGRGVELGEPRFPAPEWKQDPEFGNVAVYHHRLEVRVPLLRQRQEALPVRLRVDYQGCKENSVCYVPQHREVALTLPPGRGAGPSPAASKPGGRTQGSPAPAATTAAPVTEQDRLARQLATGNRFLTILSFYGFGLLLAFTPCVFPMVPILSSIIVGGGDRITTGRAFALSLAYVLAMAVTYTLAGVFAGLSGENLQAAFQDPWILAAFAAVFVALALSMFGFYDLQVPSFLQTRLTELSNRQKGGTLVGAAVMGFLSALIVGPCVAAPLAGALIYIGQTGDPWLGGAALFALSLGMGTPLLVIGTGAGKLLPKAGPWMDGVKALFGVLLLAVAIWMLERILPTAWTLLLWATLLIVSSVYLGAFDTLTAEASGWARLRRGLGLVVFVYGVLQLVGVARDAHDVWQPLKREGMGALATPGTGTPALRFRRLKGLATVQAALAEARAAGRPALLDFYADWCTECKRLEHNTFGDPRVQARLARLGAVLLQADVTANDADDKALLKEYRVPGPPSLLLFAPDGKELGRYRIIGYLPPERFLEHLDRAFSSAAKSPG
ncbi:MAG: protein-disulfide reductase DsbD [Gammaproteobacteria bacterium]|nr:MAG: protein-disulfide reductase DsbD [Gammaproteobacteria bacterium]